MARPVVVNIIGKETVSNASQKSGGALTRLANQTKRANSSMIKSFVDVKASIDLVQRAFSATVSIITDFTDAYDSQLTANKKLTSALKSTNNIIGVSEASFDRMANSLADITTIADETITEAQGLALTFTKIGRDVFPETIERAADMSEMFGQSLRQSMLTLGVALNDPIRGYTRLRRIGISFAEEQTKQIRILQESGDIMAAQRVILDELAIEFGGLARAIGATALGAMKRMQNRFVDFQESIGQVIVEGLQPFFEHATRLFEYLSANAQIVEGFVQTISVLGKVLLDVIRFIIDFREIVIAFITTMVIVPGILGAVTAGLGAMGVAANAALGPIGVVAGALTILGAGINTIVRGIDEQNKKIKEAQAEYIKYKQIVSDAIDGISGSVAEYNEALDLIEEKTKDYRKLQENASQLVIDYYDQEIERLAIQADLIKLNREEYEKFIQTQRAIEGALSTIEDYQKAQSTLNGYISSMTESLGKANIIQAFFLNTGIALRKDQIKQIDTYIDQLNKESDEYKKMIEEKTKIEETFAEKVFQLQATKLEQLDAEQKKQIAAAEKVGANTYNIFKYYETLKTDELQKQNKKRLEEELKAFQTEIEARESAIAYIQNLENEYLEGTIEGVQRQKESAIKALQERITVIRKLYGEFIDDHGNFIDAQIKDEDTLDQKSIETFNRQKNRAKELSGSIQNAYSEIFENYIAQMIKVQKAEDSLILADKMMEAQIAVQGVGLAFNQVENEIIKIEEARNKVIDVISELEIGSSEFDKWFDLLKKINNELAETDKRTKRIELREALKQTEDMVNQISGIFDTVGTAIEKAIQGGLEASDAFDFFSSLAVQVGGLFGEEGKMIGGIIASVIKIGESIYKVFDAANEQARKEAEQHAAALEQLYNRAASGIEASLSEAFVGGIEKAKIKEKLAEIFAQARFDKMLEATYRVDIRPEERFGIFLLPQEKEIITLRDRINEISRLTGDDAEKAFEDLWRRISIAWGDGSTAFADQVEQTENLVSVIGNMDDALTNALLAGDPFETFEMALEDELRKVILEAIKTSMLYSEQLQSVQEMIRTALSEEGEGGIALTQKEINDITDTYKRVFTGINEAYTQTLETLDLTIERETVEEEGDTRIYGGNTTVQRAPEINVFQYNSGVFIGEQGKAAVGRYVVEAIEEYIGQGGNVKLIVGGV